MLAHRSSLPALPNLVKILTYDTDHDPLQSSNLPSTQRKSPLRSTTISKRLKLLHAKSISTIMKTQPDEQEKSVQTVQKRKESGNDSSLLKLELKIECPLKNKEIVSQKKHLPKLYTESMYKKYSEKVNALKDKGSVNYSNTSQEMQEKKEDGRVSLRELILKTEEQLQHSYSIKYLGVKNEGIGVLSRRVPISQLEPRSRRSSLSTGRSKDFIAMNEKISEIVNMSKKKASELRNSSSLYKEGHMSSSRHVNSEESVMDMDRRIEKEYRGAQSYRACGVITEMEENKTLETSHQGDETYQHKLTTEANNLNDSIFTKEGYKETIQKGSGFIRLTSHGDYTGNTVEDKSMRTVEEVQGQKQEIAGDVTPTEVYTSYVVNKFVTPHKLKSIRKKSCGMLGQKGLKALQVDSDQLNREVYMTANYASFERQVASLQKLKSTMLRTRAKSNVKAEVVQQGNSGEGRSGKKEQHKYSYAKLLSTMYTQEDLEGEMARRSIVIGKDDDDDLLEQDDERENVEKMESNRKKEKGLKRDRRSKSYEEGVGRSAKAQWGMIRNYLKNPMKML